MLSFLCGACCLSFFSLLRDRQGVSGTVAPFRMVVYSDSKYIRDLTEAVRKEEACVVLVYIILRYVDGTVRLLVVKVIDWFL